jgi:parallel beta-helix repeat protein
MKMSLRSPIFKSLFYCLALFPALVLSSHSADTFYVDYEAGKDSNSGKTQAEAWKHAPGDSQAEGNSAAHSPGAGEVIRFKGGVVYRGSIQVKESGEAGKPIVFDGNTSGDWGNGQAVIDGGTPVASWQRCKSADEAGGNPRWAEIFYTEVPRPADFSKLNLTSADSALPIAQHPNPRDFFWQQDPSDFLVSSAQLVAEGASKIKAGEGTRENKQRPLINLILGGKNKLAVVDPIAGGSFTITMDEPGEIVAVGIAPQPKYAAVKDVVFFGNGKEILRTELAKGQSEIQTFELPAPVTISELTVKLLSPHEGETGTYTVLREIAAYDRKGANLLESPDAMTFSDPVNLNQKDKNYYDGMSFVLHCGNNIIINLPVKSFDPATGTLEVGATGESQYKETRYSLMNSVRLIDAPGEYSVADTDDPKISRVHFLPNELKDGAPVDIAVAKEKFGFALDGVSHVTVQGFQIRRQNGSALSAQGPGSNITFKDCEATLVRGTVISGTKVNEILVENCNVHDNPGHSKGIVLHTCDGAIVRNCKLVRNTNTALDYYGCSNGEVVGNTVLENKGSHANGLTFYIGNKNILVDRNYVAKGNIALTLQEGENLTFQNNILSGDGRNAVVGFWPVQPLKNIRFLNNTIVYSDPSRDFRTGMFSNSRTVEGLEVVNNIIDGLYSDYGFFKQGTLRNNLYTRLGKDQAQGLIGTDELVETDLKKIFVDPENGDFRLAPSSPARGAGVNVGVQTDFEGNARPGGPVNIGAF